MKLKIPSDAFNGVYLPYLYDKSRYLVFYGGAGSGKSVFVAQRYIIKLLSNPLCNLLCIRAVGNTNRNSTFAVFKQVIRKWGLSELFRIYESDLKIRCTVNENTILFKGLDDSEKLKSITFENGELTDIWAEEASEICEDDFNQLDVRLRGRGTKKQIVVSFNPVDINHWLKKRFFDGKTEAAVLHTSYKDNLFLDEDYHRLLESYKETDRYYYDVYCLGRWGVMGNTVFNAAAINDRICALCEPLKQGRFSYTDNGLLLEGIEWCDESDGVIKIYSPPEKYVPYVIGADTAGEGSDNFAAQVLDNRTGRQVATLLQRCDEDIFAKQIFCLGKYYNNALIGIEANFSTYPIRELERLGYQNQYVRESEDEFTHKVLHSFGFKTTLLTRPVIIASLVSTLREDIGLLNDKKTLEELLTFVRNSHGRAEAQQGAHDDLVMALAIAYYIRPQQDYAKSLPQTAKRKWESDMLEDYMRASAEERREMDRLWG